MFIGASRWVCKYATFGQPIWSFRDSRVATPQMSGCRTVSSVRSHELKTRELLSARIPTWRGVSAPESAQCISLRRSQHEAETPVVFGSSSVPLADQLRHDADTDSEDIGDT
ncbi:hypothetical protein BIW11_05646 [Tropilaelaps mercedesae]|uniref:Uncharacterized protein n=1 Tax=Tropilaelaps mercedesae TaxID=418985 RepID=A0A1V9Y1T7_9ACAR|nr:hypothetical protein BIW11_05646 [Tropilaelaps mercedesae]